VFGDSITRAEKCDQHLGGIHKMYAVVRIVEGHEAEAGRPQYAT
jgi:hypothetical protein